VLDIGAGRGDFVGGARDRGFRATALDLEAEAVLVWPNLELAGVIGSGADLPFAAAAFEAVRLKEVLEHVNEPLLLVREARRVLKPDGLLLIHVPTQWSQFYPVGNFWDDYTHVRPFSRTGLFRLLADGGFEVLSLAGYTSGRNPVERALGAVLGRTFPHIYRVLARPRPAGQRPRLAVV
jgi:SAM-dependent methyltransferase